MVLELTVVAAFVGCVVLGHGRRGSAGTGSRALPVDDAVTSVSALA
ncbi:hypothetical protein ABT052_35915 [Streptomyces sp. NPDC002766]